MSELGKIAFKNINYTSRSWGLGVGLLVRFGIDDAGSQGSREPEFFWGNLDPAGAEQGVDETSEFFIAVHLCSSLAIFGF